MEKLKSTYSLGVGAELFSRIIEISSDFMATRPTVATHHDTIISKYAHMHWRLVMKNKVLSQLTLISEARLFEQLVSSLQSLGLSLKMTELDLIYTHYLKLESVDSKIMLSFFAQQADLEHFKRCGGQDENDCGPQRILKMEANHKSGHTISKWGKDPEFGKYRFHDGGVIYRGIHFLPGDVLLNSVNLGGNGCFTTFTEPRNYCFHNGFFVIIDYKGRKLPVVLETYELGVRLVPLSQFLCHRFSNYIEVLRSEEILPEHFDQLGRRAYELAEECLGYNFDTEDDDKHYFACTSLGRALYACVGLEPIAPKSVVKEKGIMDNLKCFGVMNELHLFPVDFLVDPKYSRVGLIDNGAFEMCVAQEISDRICKDGFCRGEVCFRRLPLHYHFIYFGVRLMQRGDIIAKIVSFLGRFPYRYLPKGSAKTAAMVENCSVNVGRMEKKLERLIAPEIAWDCFFDIESFWCQWGEAAPVKKIYRPFRKWFSLS